LQNLDVSIITSGIKSLENMKDNKKLYKINLNNDEDGSIWNLLVSMVIDKANFFKFHSVFTNQGDWVSSAVLHAREHARELGFSKTIAVIYPMEKKQPDGGHIYQIIVKIALDPEIRAKIRSYKTLTDMVTKNDDDIYNPSFFFHGITLLSSVTSMGFAKILLSPDEKKILDGKISSLKSKMKAKPMNDRYFIPAKELMKEFTIKGRFYKYGEA